MGDDELLVRDCQRGDRAAFEELVRRTGRLVFARLYLDTGDSHRAEDLAQETFLIAWQKIGQMTEPSGFRAWLLTIARTVAINAQRYDSRKKRSGLRLASETTESPDPLPEPAAAADLTEQRQRALEALRSLPEAYRLPLMLRYLEGSDYQAISQKLALSNGSLRGLLQRGLNLLREKLKQP